MIGTRILLIEYDNTSFVKQLQELRYSIIEIHDISQVKEKIIETSPNLIICPLKLKGHSGFEVYNLIKNLVVHQKIPYLLIADKFKNKDIYIAEEMGIDGYLFPPFDSDIINNIITAKIKKSNEINSSEENRFRTICEIMPYAIFIVKGNTITETNNVFYELPNLKILDSEQLLMEDVFDFSKGNNEIKLMRMMNGLTTKEIFRNITIVDFPIHTYNLYLSNINSSSSFTHILGIAIPCMTPNATESGSFIEHKSAYIDKNKQEKVFTHREEQVLKLSAIGTPTKLIADELGISARTVEKHRSNIIRKTNSGNIIEAIIYARNHYILEIFD